MLQSPGPRTLPDDSPNRRRVLGPEMKRRKAAGVGGRSVLVAERETRIHSRSHAYLPAAIIDGAAEGKSIHNDVSPRAFTTRRLNSLLLCITPAMLTCKLLFVAFDN